MHNVSIVSILAIIFILNKEHKMNKLLLSALYAMNAVQLSRPAMAHNGSDNSADHMHQGSGHDDLMSHLYEGRHADDATNNANKDRRGKSESGHHRYGRRATDIPDQDEHEDDTNNPASHQ